MWKCQFCEKMNFDDQAICPHCNAPNPSPVKPVFTAANTPPPTQGGPYQPPYSATGQTAPNTPDNMQRAKKRDSIIKYVLIGVAALSVLIMLSVLVQTRGERKTADNAALVTPTPIAQTEEAAIIPAVEEEPAPVLTEAPEPANDPVVVTAVADIYLNFGDTYQCSTEDFVLPYEIDEADIVWSCDYNESGTECSASGLITGGNTQVDGSAEYNEPVLVVGTTADGSELSYNVITGNGKTYDFSWSSGRRNMKNYNGAVILIDPMIVNCDGFSIYYQYELTKGSLNTDTWSVWVRENGTEWIRIQDITVEDQVGEVYDIVFDEPLSFSEICVQPETYSDNYSYSDSFAVGYLVFH